VSEQARPLASLVGVLRALRACCCTAVLASAVALVAAAAKAQDSTPSIAVPRDYDIPAQPLDVALNAYIQASGAQVLYETALTKGRQSTDVKGRLTSEAALEALLSGTGLVAQRIDVDAFVITQSPTHQGPAATESRPDGRFMTALQTGVLEALCRTALTRPGGYKVAIELWIAPTGFVQRSALIGSSGDMQRDRMLLSALRNVSIRMPPPAGFPQPFILAIGPRRETGDCPG
jgi:hypothetical protein